MWGINSESHSCLRFEYNHLRHNKLGLYVLLILLTCLSESRTSNDGFSNGAQLPSLSRSIIQDIFPSFVFPPQKNKAFLSPLLKKELNVKIGAMEDNPFYSSLPDTETASFSLNKEFKTDLKSVTKPLYTNKKQVTPTQTVLADEQKNVQDTIALKDTISSHRISWKSPLGLWYCFLAVCLVLFAGFASGVTLGLLSLDPVQLKVLDLEGTEEERKGIRVVSQVIQRHHLLLVTLLLSNAIALETLPIFLDRLVPAWAAVFLSVVAILLFGEIIPQAVCTGRNQLAIAQAAAPIVNVLIAIFFVISWPIAKLLDHLLGHTEHHAYYARAHLKALIRMHEKERRVKDGTAVNGTADSNSALGADEVIVIEGALDLADKTVEQIMLPIDNVFMLSCDTLMDRMIFNTILASGHSRVPIYSGSRHNVKGLILTKSLLSVDPSAGILAGDLIVKRKPIFTPPHYNVYHLLNEFQKGHSHIAFVTIRPEEYTYCLKKNIDVAPEATLMGIVTLEDVIEELIQEEIYDEFDENGGGIHKLPMLNKQRPLDIRKDSVSTGLSHLFESHSKIENPLRQYSTKSDFGNMFPTPMNTSYYSLIDGEVIEKRSHCHSCRDLPEIIQELKENSCNTSQPFMRRFSLAGYGLPASSSSSPVKGGYTLSSQLTAPLVSSELRVSEDHSSFKGTRLYSPLQVKLKVKKPRALSTTTPHTNIYQPIKTTQHLSDITTYTTTTPLLQQDPIYPEMTVSQQPEIINVKGNVSSTGFNQNISKETHHTITPSTIESPNNMVDPCAAASIDTSIPFINDLQTHSFTDPYLKQAAETTTILHQTDDYPVISNDVLLSTKETDTMIPPCPSIVSHEASFIIKPLHTKKTKKKHRRKHPN